MKRLIILSSLILLACSSFAQNDVEHFEVRFIMKDFNKKLKEAKLLVYNNGTLYKTYETSNGKFNLELPINDVFMFEFTSSQHYTKRIAINTEIDNHVHYVPELDLTMSLIPTNIQYLANEDLDLLDFPVAYISFDGKKNEFFDINESYSKILINEIEKSNQNYLAEN